MKQYPKQLLSLILSIAITFPASSFAQQAKHSDPYANHEANIEKASKLTDSKKLKTLATLTGMSAAYLAGHWLFGKDGDLMIRDHVNFRYALQTQLTFSEYGVINSDGMLYSYLNVRYEYGLKDGLLQLENWETLAEKLPNVEKIFSRLDQFLTYDKKSKQFIIRGTGEKFYIDTMAGIARTMQYFWPENGVFEQKHLVRILHMMEASTPDFMVGFMRHYGRDVVHDSTYEKVLQFLRNDPTAKLTKEKTSVLGYPAGPELMFEAVKTPEFEKAMKTATSLAPEAFELRSHVVTPEIQTMMKDVIAQEGHINHVKGRVMRQRLYYAGGVILATAAILYGIWSKHSKSPISLNYNLSDDELVAMATEDTPMYIHLLEEDIDFSKSMAMLVDQLTQADADLQSIQTLLDQIQTQP